MILLDERQEVLMLVTNSLKNDLNSRNQYIVGLALTALGNICSAEMARDLAPEVEKLLASTNPYIRKKAALCARRVMRKVPDMLESFVDRATELLNDRNHAVILGGVTLMLEIADQEPATQAIFRDQVPLLCRILRALLVGGFSADYDVGGICDPYLQTRILRLLSILGHGNPEASDAMSDVLAQVATNTESTRSAGNAILYECVRTIMAVESIGGLRVLAVNTLGRFLAHRDNNIRYVALNTLARVVSVDAQAVQRHRATIVECVKDPDASIRRKALELVYALINEGNVRALTAELLDYLRVCDPEFKPDLTAKICDLVQRYAPDNRWYVDSMIRTLSEAGPFVKEEACRALITVIVNTSQLHGYASRALYKALQARGEAAAPALISVGVWCIGEYADVIVTGANKVEGEGSTGVATENELVAALANVFTNTSELPNICREHALTALVKISARCPNTTDQVHNLLEERSNCVALEEQSRSVEYSRLFSHEAIRGQVLEHMPALEETAYDAALDVADDGAHDADGAASAAVDLAALLGLDVGLHAAAENTTIASSQSDAGGAAGGLAALQDLLGTGGGGGDPFSASSLSPPQGSQGSSVQPAARLTAYTNDILEIVFSLTHGGTPGATDIVAEFRNKTAEPIAGFSLQAAVPKVFQLKLDPASGRTLPPVGESAAAVVTQKIHVTNTMPGQKALVMRLRMSYTGSDGQHVVQQAEVAFPPGF
jgi:AP-1 complex subunit gamma-1